MVSTKYLITVDIYLNAYLGREVRGNTIPLNPLRAVDEYIRHAVFWPIVSLTNIFVMSKCSLWFQDLKKTFHGARPVF